MLSLSRPTKPFLSETIEGILHHIASELVPKGYFYWFKTLAQEPTDEFDREVLETIETEKWRAGGKPIADVRYLRFNNECVFMVNEGPHPLLDWQELNDIRNTPLGYCGYEVRYNTAEDRVLISIEKPRFELPSWMYPTDPPEHP